MGRQARRHRRVAGAIGGLVKHHLRQSFVFLDILPLQAPEAYIGGAGKLFAADGSITVPETQAFMQKYLNAFAAWIERVAPK